MEFALFMQGPRGAAVTKAHAGAGRYVRQNGPPGRFGVIDLIVEPCAKASLGCFLSWEVAEEKIPLIYLDGVISGIKRVLADESCSADRLYDTRIRVVDGAFHETDSKLSCYYVATILAFRSALREAGIYTQPSPDA
ncbi:hypothetical protein HH212_24365 [Massilia forsythiae]|uniref:Translation elongation factor EFG/EF2 domain-containing protein n=1 Tax=Massilia forsythiae TaxID=2728020 RepID=A0A7Z2W0N4_9BURK|nr:hypothetical protein [Massilia forsythiae]QJE02751.1 hypothetical protein HH212_24365 [Massilia forsythiae]